MASSGSRVNTRALRYQARRSSLPVKFSELDRDRVTTVLRTFIRYEQMSSGDRTDHVVLDIVYEAVGDVVDCGGTVELERRLRSVRKRRERFVGNEIG